MKITSLEKMEEIVRSNRALHWDGWNVVSTFPNPGAWSKPDGVFIKNKWYTKRVFRITEVGWEIPNKLVR